MEETLTEQELNSLNEKVSSIFSGLNLDSVTDSSTGFEDLPTGYYYCVVTGAKVQLSKKGDLGALFKFKTKANGLLDEYNEETGTSTLVAIPKTANKSVTKWYSLKDESDAKKFVSDVLKFTDEEGTPLVPKEVFKEATYEQLNDFLALLEDVCIYVYVDVKVNKDSGEKQVWYNLISNTRARQLDLLD